MSTCCPAVAGQFDQEYVEREVVSRQRKGPGKTARRLVEALSGLDVQKRTLLDIGGGLGDIQAGLFPRGLRGAVHVEVSDAYSDASVRDAGVRFAPLQASSICGSHPHTASLLPSDGTGETQCPVVSRARIASPVRDVGPA